MDVDLALYSPAVIIYVLAGKNVKGNIFAADASKTLRYTGTTQDLLDSLYPRITELQGYNTKTASQNANSGSKTLASLAVGVLVGLLHVLLQ